MKITLFAINALILSRIIISCDPPKDPHTDAYYDRKADSIIASIEEKNNPKTLLHQTKHQTDSIMALINNRASKKFPGNNAAMDSEIQDQMISFDYIESMDPNEFVEKARNKFPEDYVKQKDEFNKLLEQSMK